ncbi:MAG: Hpt domain-containing protein [Proteobacteria bacterium]|nr:Hpt domain-containing protein [Pseudomonadota bacterium]
MEEKKIIVFINEELEEIVPLFIEKRYKDIEEISKCLNSEDYDTIRRLGHNIKGTAGGYGFLKIMEIGRDIERYASEKSSGKIIEEINKLKYFLDNLEIRYEREHL